MAELWLFRYAYELYVTLCVFAKKFYTSAKGMNLSHDLFHVWKVCPLTVKDRFSRKLDTWLYNWLTKFLNEHFILFYSASDSLFLEIKLLLIFNHDITPTVKTKCPISIFIVLRASWKQEKLWKNVNRLCAQDVNWSKVKKKCLANDFNSICKEFKYQMSADGTNAAHIGVVIERKDEKSSVLMVNLWEASWYCFKQSSERRSN